MPGTLKINRQQYAAWLWAGIALLITAFAIMPFDAPLSEWIGALAPDKTIQRRIIKQSYRVFEWYTYLIVAGVLLLQPIRWRLLKGYGIAIGLGAVIIHSLKFCIGRARPQVHEGAFQFEPFALGDYTDAFPSGHVGGAVMLSLLVGLYFPPLRWPLLFLSALVATGRIIQERHFVSDTLAGAGIAVLVIYACYQWLGVSYYPPLSAQHEVAASNADRDDSSNEIGA